MKSHTRTVVGRVCEINQYKLTITELRSYNATESVFDRGVASGSSPWACYTALIDFQSAAPRGCITAGVTDNARGLLGRNPDESSALPTVSPTPSPSPCSECCGAGATYYVTDDDSGTYPSRAGRRAPKWTEAIQNASVFLPSDLASNNARSVVREMSP